MKQVLNAYKILQFRRINGRKENTMAICQECYAEQKEIDGSHFFTDTVLECSKCGLVEVK